MQNDRANGPIFITGASGYIGGRLVPRLLDLGYPVRVLAREPGKLRDRPWADHPQVEILRGDILDGDALKPAVAGCRAAYYLIHSMNPKVGDFAATDRLAARNMAEAAQTAGLEQIIYLGGLGDDGGTLSHHLQSRREVGRILMEGAVPVTILRAAMIIGSGSASFEILRYLVERLPLMVTPRWIDTPCQPVAIRNVLHYLIGCLLNPDTFSRSFDIGQPDVTTYRQLMTTYAQEAGLRPRHIFSVPVLTPRLSSYWIHLVTPVPAAIARPLAEGLSNPVTCQNSDITRLLPQQLLSARESIRLALERVRQQQVETSWTDSGLIPPAEWSIDGDPKWAGGNIYEDARRILIKASPRDVWPHIKAIGGPSGYYYADWLWQLRGLIDRLLGGVGLKRGKRESTQINPGDAIDFWRVLDIRDQSQLFLVAEMKLPGQAVLVFRIREAGEKVTEVQQIARFLPRGLAGILYWHAVMPFHHFVFNGMLQGIAAATGQTLLEGPHPFTPDRTD